MPSDPLAITPADLSVIRPLLTTQEVAKLYRVSQRTVQDWIREGALLGLAPWQGPQDSPGGPGRLWRDPEPAPPTRGGVRQGQSRGWGGIRRGRAPVGEPARMLHLGIFSIIFSLLYF
jgi:excisionase family DNA binding protein